ncbi:MAG: hypothetical protein GX491_05055 [Chloroflexi bacterium]|nr:hypothetical protein [Chloroflexota bacterium]
MFNERLPRVAASTCFICVLFLISLLLRVYHIGFSSFWLDEAGVAMAITSPDLAGMFAIQQTHVMAMPLDYLVGWVVARFCQSDACLRMPSAVWGALTIPLVYALACRFISRPAAALSALMLALAPFHIYYSQELRFYASLTFFYTLATLLLWEALQKPSLRRWAAFILVTAVGSYFHIYVTLVFVNGLALLLARQGEPGQRFWTPGRLKAFQPLLISGAIAAAAVLPGLLANLPVEYAPLGFDVQTHIVSFISNFTLYKVYPEPRTVLLVISVVVIWLFLIGLRQVKASRNRPLAAMLLSILLQIIFITSLDVIHDYWILARQFIQYLPWLCMVTVIGLLRLIQETARRVSPRQITIAAAAAVLLVSLPLIPDLYRYRKAHWREISQEIADTCRPGDVIIIYTPPDVISMKYYLQQFGDSEVANSVKGFIEFDPANLQEYPDRLYVIMKANDAQEHADALLAGGFRQTHYEHESPGSYKIWLRTHRLGAN